MHCTKALNRLHFAQVECREKTWKGGDGEKRLAHKHPGHFCRREAGLERSRMVQGFNGGQQRLEKEKPDLGRSHEPAQISFCFILYVYAEAERVMQGIAYLIVSAWQKRNATEVLQEMGADG